jgi:hypothetical protein
METTGNGFLAASFRCFMGYSLQRDLTDRVARGICPESQGYGPRVLGRQRTVFENHVDAGDLLKPPSANSDHLPDAGGFAG